MPKAKRSRAWCFTSYKKDDVRDPHSAIYFTCGWETCPTTGRRHQQGYIRFAHAHTKSSTQSLLGDSACHCEPRRGSEREAAEYCQKDGDFRERGEIKESEQGRRTDIELVRKLLYLDGGGIRAVIDADLNYQCIRWARLRRMALSMLWWCCKQR